MTIGNRTSGGAPADASAGVRGAADAWPEAPKVSTHLPRFQPGDRRPFLPFVFFTQLSRVVLTHVARGLSSQAVGVTGTGAGEDNGIDHDKI